jgi:hypothetical protein
LARLVTGALASGIRALRSVVSCFSEVNFKCTVAFALVAIQHSIAKTEVQSNKQNLITTKK